MEPVAAATHNRRQRRHDLVCVCTFACWPERRGAALLTLSRRGIRARAAATCCERRRNRQRLIASSPRQRRRAARVAIVSLSLSLSESLDRRDEVAADCDAHTVAVGSDKISCSLTLGSGGGLARERRPNRLLFESTKATRTGAPLVESCQSVQSATQAQQVSTAAAVATHEGEWLSCRAQPFKSFEDKWRRRRRRRPEWSGGQICRVCAPCDDGGDATGRSKSSCSRRETRRKNSSVCALFLPLKLQHTMQTSHNASEWNAAPAPMEHETGTLRAAATGELYEELTGRRTLFGGEKLSSLRRRKFLANLHKSVACWPATFAGAVEVAAIGPPESACRATAQKSRIKSRGELNVKSATKAHLESRPRALHLPAANIFGHKRRKRRRVFCKRRRRLCAHCVRVTKTQRLQFFSCERAIARTGGAARQAAAGHCGSFKFVARLRLVVGIPTPRAAPLPTVTGEPIWRAPNKSVVSASLFLVGGAIILKQFGMLTSRRTAASSCCHISPLSPRNLVNANARKRVARSCCYLTRTRTQTQAHTKLPFAHKRRSRSQGEHLYFSTNSAGRPPPPDKRIQLLPPETSQPDEF